MSFSFNQAILVGNVGRDPDIRTTTAGDRIASFTLATSEQWKSKTGEKQEATEWHNIVCFDSLKADLVEKHLRTGTRVFVRGKIKSRKWTDREGKERYVTEIVLNRFDGELIILSPLPGGGKSAVVAASNMDDEIPF